MFTTQKAPLICDLRYSLEKGGDILYFFSSPCDNYILLHESLHNTGRYCASMKNESNMFPYCAVMMGAIMYSLYKHVQIFVNCTPANNLQKTCKKAVYNKILNSLSMGNLYRMQQTIH